MSPQSKSMATASRAKRRWWQQHYTMKGMENKSIEMRRHPWNVSPQEARWIQANLRKLWEGKDRLGKIRTVAGLDTAFVITGPQALSKQTNRWNRLREANRAIACVILFQFPEMEEIAREFAIVPLEFPYVPGLLSFREIPALLAALKKLKRMPDLLFCDGQGIAHPRRLGLASHLGVLLDKPSIGCAKSLLIGTHGALKAKAGGWTELIDEKAEDERIGAVLRTRDGVRPIYVSQGNRVSLETALRLTLQVTDGFRIPRPTRAADHFAGEVKRKLLEELIKGLQTIDPPVLLRANLA
jgi:deoxyribonuclease V